MAINTSPPAGTRDFLPEDIRRREYVIGLIRKAYERHGFVPLETPAIERIETLSGKYGEEGEQLIFRIMKRGDKLAQETTVDAARLSDMGLRYDLTVPLARVVAAYQSKLPKYFKRYQIQPVWRADRPQKGRFREFFQCDVDFVGTESMVAELEVLQAIGDALASLKFDRFTIRLNDRRVLTGMMEAAGIPKEKHLDAITAIDKLDKIGAEGVLNELRDRGVEESRFDSLRPLLLEGVAAGAADNARRLAELDSLFDDGRSATGAAGAKTMRELLAQLSEVEALHGRVVLDPALARGLSYYTGPIFEIAVEGLSGSMGGGGRYDDLVGMFLGRRVPAVGFSLGLERILVVMEERKMLPELASASEVMVAQLDARLLADCMRLARRLREAGLRVETYPEQAKLGNQLKYAESQRVPVVAILGENEVKAGTVGLKQLSTGKQEVVALADAASVVRAMLSAATGEAG